MKAILPPLLFGIALFGLWELALWALAPEFFLLPPPSDIAVAVHENWAEIWDATQTTGFIILTGLAMGTVSAVVVALVVTRFRTANQTLTPLAVAVNAIPIIALAPILNVWLGLTSARSNQVVVALVVFFPVFVNTARGLAEVSPLHLELMRSYGAGPWRTMVNVRIPNALPYFFTALKVASSLSVIAAIVAEYFGGRQNALGPMIQTEAGFTRYAEAWAAVTAGATIGILLYVSVLLIEHVVSPPGVRVAADSR